MGHPPAGYFAPYDLPNLEDAPHKEYLTDRLTDEAVGFIEQNKDQDPLFLYLSHYAVHTPSPGAEETWCPSTRRSAEARTTMPCTRP